jgi:hypothetical protein
MSLNGYANRLLAKSNPSTPEMNVPQFLGELKDLPSLIRGWGRNILGNLGNTYLQYRWGIKPLVSDLISMLNFQHLAQKRFKTLQKLRDGKRLGKRKVLDFGMKTRVGSGFVAQSFQRILYAHWHDVYSHKVWGTVQWYTPAYFDLRKYDDDELMLKARRQAFGFSQAGITAAAWELLPWSWLADWFGNVGDIISNNANQVDVQYKGLCIMQHSKLHRKLIMESALVSGEWNLAMDDLICTHERKKRYHLASAVSFPSFRMQILTDSHLSIVAALTAARISGNDRVAFLRLGR